MEGVDMALPRSPDILCSVSLFLIGNFSTQLPGRHFDQYQSEEVLSLLGPVAILLLWLGPINIILALFNLVPGFPLNSS
jgi:Zn-dependent protease